MEEYDTIVIGGGPAGLAAAIKATELGLRTLLIEASGRLGGIPLQCIHSGFGLHYFREDLTGTEFIQRFIDRVKDLGVKYLLHTYVVDVEVLSHSEKVVKALSPGRALELRTKTIIYAAGARERHVYEIGIVGDRPAGVYTAGEAQAMMDLYGLMPGRRVVIIGSGDVGLIMARRLALEGAEVVAVVEIMPWPGGLTRNIIQCLQDYGISLLLNHAVTEIHGKHRVESVTVAQVDEELRPIPGTESLVKCDTVIVAAGLIPNTELLEKLGVIMDRATRGPKVNELLETSIPGVFTAGNALVINDLVDNVVKQGELAATAAKMFVDSGGIPTSRWVPIVRGKNVRLVVPHYVSGERDVELYLRVSKPMKRACISIAETGRKVCLPRVMPAEMVVYRLRRGEVGNDIGKLTVEVIESG